MRKKEASVLLVDDDDDILFSAKIGLKKYFTNIITTNDPKTIIAQLANQIDVVLLDMKLPYRF